MNSLQHFTKENGYVWVSNTFVESFGNLPFKASKTTLEYKTLPRRMNDASILAELNPEVITLGEMDHFLKTANRKFFYIFYVNDYKGVLWAVSAFWDDDGWNVHACSVSFPNEWDDGRRVVSRGFSVPESLETLSSLEPKTLYLEQRVAELERRMDAIVRFGEEIVKKI